MKCSKARLEFDHLSGKINLSKAGRYSMKYDAGKLVELSYHGHPPAVVKIDPAEVMISMKRMVQDVHSDLDAAFVRDPLPPEHLKDFFPDGEGPKAARLFNFGKAKEWKEYIEEKRSEYDRIHLVNDECFSNSVEAKAKIDEQKLDLRKGQIQKARQAMQERMKEEVGKRRYKAE